MVEMMGDADSGNGSMGALKCKMNKEGVGGNVIDIQWEIKNWIDLLFFVQVREGKIKMASNMMTCWKHEKWKPDFDEILWMWKDTN